MRRHFSVGDAVGFFFGPWVIKRGISGYSLPDELLAIIFEAANDGGGFEVVSHVSRQWRRAATNLHSVERL